MRSLRVVFAICAVLLLSRLAQAQEFIVVTKPSFDAIQAREVYGSVIYDFSFAGDGPNSRGQSAMGFLKSQMESKFQNKEGNYIVTLELFLNGNRIASEPVISANWKTNKFLFLTTSEKSNIVINRNGVLLEHLVIDQSTNKVQLSLKILRSDSTAVDMSLFKEVADLSKTAAISAFVPGLAGIAEAYAPFTSLLTNLLSRYTSASIVDNTIAAFTLLDTGFANQLQYKTNKFVANIYLQTIPSQLSTSFVNGKFKTVAPGLPLIEVKSGVGAARAPVLDIIQARPNEDIADFTSKIRTFKPYGTQPQAQTDIRDKCALLRNKIAELVSTRDTALLYWAFLTNYRSELQEYRDGKKCGTDSSLVGEFADLGLVLNPADWQ
ncbi:MAG: hypothetical protein JNJ53_05315 [Rhizobiales bacterium]|nr:hypothetical protein [Hyphomicrobiales bacterium]